MHIKKPSQIFVLKPFQSSLKLPEDMNLDLVLNREASLIFLPHLNISDEVLIRLNERTKNARIEIQVQEPQSQ